jgi:hypothetical protein
VRVPVHKGVHPPPNDHPTFSYHRTILLFHIVIARPSKQSLMVRTFLKVYMELGSYFLFLQEQIKEIIITWGVSGVNQSARVGVLIAPAKAMQID